MLYLQKVIYDRVKNIYKYVDKSKLISIDSDNIDDIPNNYCPFVCAKSQLFCLDIDVKGKDHRGFSKTASNYETIINLLQFQALQDHYAEDTRSFGVHILFFVPDELEPIAREIRTSFIEILEYAFTVECFYKTDRLIYTTSCTEFKNIKPINSIDTFVKKITREELELVRDTLNRLRKEPVKIDKNNNYKPVMSNYTQQDVKVILDAYIQLIKQQGCNAIYTTLSYSSYCDFWVNIGLAIYNTNPNWYDLFEYFSANIPVNEDDTEEYNERNTCQVWKRWELKAYNDKKISWKTIENDYIYHFCANNIIESIDNLIPNYVIEEYKDKENVILSVEEEKNQNEQDYKLAWAKEIYEFVKKKDNHFFLLIYEYYYDFILSEQLKNEYNAVMLTMTFILSLYYDKIEFIINEKYKIHLRNYAIFLAGTNTGKNSVVNSFNFIHRTAKNTYASMQKMHQSHKHPSARCFFNVVDEYMSSRYSAILSKDNTEFNVAFKSGLMRLLDNENDFIVENSVSGGIYIPYKMFYSCVGFSAFYDFPTNLDIHGGGFNRCLIAYLMQNKVDNELLSKTDDEILSLDIIENNNYDKCLEIKDIITNIYTDINKRFNVMMTGTEQPQYKIFMTNLEAKKTEEDKKKDIKYTDEDFKDFEHQILKIYNCNVVNYLYRLSNNQKILDEKNKKLGIETHQRNETLGNRLIMSLFLDNDILNKIFKYNSLKSELTLNADFNEIKRLFVITNKMINNERIKFVAECEEMAKEKYSHKAKETLQVKEELAKKEQEIKDYFVNAFTKPERLNMEYNLKSCYSMARKMKQYLTSAYAKEMDKIISDLVSEGRLLINKERTKFKFLR